MKLVQLLTGAAAAALLAGAATAQSVTVTPVNLNDTLAADTNAPDITGNIAAENIFASEIDIAAADAAGSPINGVLMLNLDLSADLPVEALGATDQIDFTVTLTGMELTSTVSTGNFGAADNNVPAACAFTIQADGAANDTTVTFRSAANVATCDEADLQFALPVDLTAGTGNFSWAVNLVGPNTPLASGTYDANGGAQGTPTLVSQAAAIASAITAGNTSLMIAPGFTQFAGPSAIDGLGAFTITETARREDFAATAAIADDLLIEDATDNNSTFVLTFENAANLDLAFLDFNENDTVDGGEPSCVPAGNTCSITVTSAQLAAIQADGNGTAIAVRADGNGPVAQQDVSATVTFSESQTYFTIANTVGTDVGDILQDDGLAEVNVGAPIDAFPWTSLRCSGGTASQFRITGGWDVSNPPTGVIVNIGNSTVDYGVASVTLNNTQFNALNNAVTFNSANICAALGTTANGNADVSFQLVFDEGFYDGTPAAPAANTLEARRLLTRSDIVTGTGFDG